MQFLHGSTFATKCLIICWHISVILRYINYEGSCYPTNDSCNHKFKKVFLDSSDRSRSHAMLAWAHICHKCVSWLSIALSYLHVSTGWDHIGKVLSHTTKS